MQIAPGYMPPIARTRTGAETRSNNTQPLHWAQKLRREIFAGSIAAGTTASIFAPFESVKTRLQVQQAPEWPKIYEGGLMRSVMRIASEDGLALMWSHGFVPFVCRDFFYSGLRLGLYPSTRAAISGKEKGDVTLVQKIAAGAATGSIGSALANPLDVVRVRMTVEGGKIDPNSGLLQTGMRAGYTPRYRNSIHCAMLTMQEEGLVRGLYRGVGATMARAALLSAGQLASYDHSKAMLRRSGWMQEGSALHIVAAFISGLVATTMCNPADVLKSRMMIASSGAERASVGQLIATIWRQEGPIGFMRGWGAAYARAGPTLFIQMPLMEALRAVFGVGAI